MSGTRFAVFTGTLLENRRHTAFSVFTDRDRNKVVKRNRYKGFDQPG